MGLLTALRKLEALIFCRIIFADSFQLTCVILWDLLLSFLGMLCRLAIVFWIACLVAQWGLQTLGFPFYNALVDDTAQQVHYCLDVSPPTTAFSGARVITSSTKFTRAYMAFASIHGQFVDTKIC